MKKTLKTIIASILVISMLFGTVSASAVSLTTPDSEINATVPNATFTPAETGYYIAESSISGSSLSYISVKDGENNVYLYYLEKENSYSVYGDAPEFLGAEINRISATDPSVFDNFILGVDIKEGDTSISFDTSVGIVFDSKTVYTNSTTLLCEGGIVAGENEVKYNIPNYDKTKTLNAFPLEEVIYSVEIQNESKYTSAYTDYEGEVFAEDTSEAVVVINGNQEIVANEFGYFVYSSRKYPLTIEREYSEEGTPLKTKIFISGKHGEFEIASYDMEIVEASALQNVNRAIWHYYYNEMIDMYYEIIFKYASLPTYLIYLSYPVIMGETMVRFGTLYFKYLKIAVGFLLDAYY